MSDRDAPAPPAALDRIRLEVRVACDRLERAIALAGIASRAALDPSRGIDLPLARSLSLLASLIDAEKDALRRLVGEAPESHPGRGPVDPRDRAGGRP